MVKSTSSSGGWGSPSGSPLDKLSYGENYPLKLCLNGLTAPPDTTSFFYFCRIGQEVEIKLCLLRAGVRMEINLGRCGAVTFNPQTAALIIAMIDGGKARLSFEAPGLSEAYWTQLSPGDVERFFGT